MSPSRPVNRRPRSVFDIYLRENTVTYLKSPCSAADAQAQFFLHVIPEDVEDLPAHRRQYGFDNLDFHYDNHGSIGCRSETAPSSGPLTRKRHHVVRYVDFSPIGAPDNNSHAESKRPL